MRVVVIGGGYGGVEVVRRLVKVSGVEITLVEPKDALFLSVAAPRALVDEQLAIQAFVPLTEILAGLRVQGGNVQHVRRFVSEVDLTRRMVYFHDDVEPLPYDALVVATGVSFGRFRFSGRRLHSSDDREEMLRSHDRSGAGDTCERGSPCLTSRQLPPRSAEHR